RLRRIAEVLIRESDEVDRARLETLVVRRARERDDVVERGEAFFEMIAGPLRPRQQTAGALLVAEVVRRVRFTRGIGEADARGVVLAALVERVALIDEQWKTGALACRSGARGQARRLSSTGNRERDCDRGEHRYAPA